MKRSEEFLRFKDGHTVIIDFDDTSGEIEHAVMIAPEVSTGEVEITPLVKQDRYWQKRVHDRIEIIKATSDERKYFSAYKEVSND
jgi:hypothetical protein